MWDVGMMKRVENRAEIAALVGLLRMRRMMGDRTAAQEVNLSMVLRLVQIVRMFVEWTEI